MDENARLAYESARRWKLADLKRWKLGDALRVAQTIRATCMPYCERVEIVGSIRRERPEVGDIELLVIPNWREEKRPIEGALFGEELVRINLLYEFLASRSVARWVAIRDDELHDAVIKPGGKVWRSVIPAGILVEFYLVERDCWGNHCVIRTGPKEFSKAWVTYAKKIRRPSVDGYLTSNGERIITQEETDAFKALNLKYVAPPFRRDYSSLIPLRG